MLENVSLMFTRAGTLYGEENGDRHGTFTNLISLLKKISTICFKARTIAGGQRDTIAEGLRILRKKYICSLKGIGEMVEGIMMIHNHFSPD